MPELASDQRLDAYLSHALPALSRSRVKTLIDEGRVLVDGVFLKASQKVRGGERIRIDLPTAVPSEIIPQALPLDIAFEDDHLVVIHKPAGWVVHPGAGNPDGTIANALRARYPDMVIGGVERPGIVHRLDKDTSGVLVCAKTEVAHRRLSTAFKDREVRKRYTAFCYGTPKRNRIELITGHRRDEKNRLRFTTKLPPPDGDGGNVRRAHSQFSSVSSAGGISELDVELLTGRTHQIRAHAADSGHPLVADELYGGGNIGRRLPDGPVRDAAIRLTRQALHARVLEFAHPISGDQLIFESPLPDDLQRIRRAIHSVEAEAAHPVERGGSR